MAKNTPKRTARTPRAVTAAAKAVPGLSSEDAYNILILLDRVQTRGMQEAALLVTVAQKLHLIKGAFEVPKSG